MMCMSNTSLILRPHTIEEQGLEEGLGMRLG